VKLLLAAALVLMMSSLAFAATETGQLGPYTVSFDMNTNMPYQIQTPAPQETPYFTIYPLLVATDNTSIATIRITEFKNPIDSTQQMYESLAICSMRAGGLNATMPENVTIDGKSGFLIPAVPFEGANLPATMYYEAQYWLDSKDCECGPVSVGTKQVIVTSSYPEDVTRNLLNTLTVTEGQPQALSQAGQMAQPQMPVDMPPADMSQQPPH
jgi:hypothetical protein